VWTMLSVRGAAGCLLLSVGLFGGAFVCLGLSLPLLFISEAAYRVVVGRIQRAWGYFICGIAERVYGVRFCLSGDALPPVPRRVLLISNHRTRLDWLFLWSMSLFAHNGAGLRIVLKAGLKDVPFFGWALQQFDCLFLQVRLFLL
jgi:lysocardiolipin and lysophospholipid acyltransferase